METYTEFALVAHRGLGAEIFIEPLKELGIKATPFFFHELPDLHTLKRFSAIICIRDFSSTNLLDRVKRHANEGNVPLFVLSRKTSHWASLLSAGLLGGSVQSREDALTRLFALDEERPPRWFEFVGQNPHLQGFMPSTVRSLAALKDFLSRIPPEKLPESLRKKYQGVDAPPSQPNPVTAPPEPEVVSEPAPPAPAPVELVLGVDQAEYDLLKEEYDSLVQIHEAAKARIVELEQQIGGYQENLGQLTQAYTERKDWVSPQAVAKLRDKMLAEKAKELLEGQQRQAALEKQVKGLQEELGAYDEEYEKAQATLEKAERMARESNERLRSFETSLQKALKDLEDAKRKAEAVPPPSLQKASLLEAISGFKRLVEQGAVDEGGALDSLARWVEANGKARKKLAGVEAGDPLFSYLV